MHPMIRCGLRLASLVVVLAFIGCTPKPEDKTTVTVEGTGDAQTPPADTAAKVVENTTPTPPATAPDHVEVQHVLIGFEGKIPGKAVTRSQAEAEKLAGELLSRARNGEDFDQLVQKYTDDQWPGIYGLANTGITPAEGEFTRDGMVKGFSDVAFNLSPGNVDMANYDPKTSPYGWHIIKRIK